MKKVIKGIMIVISLIFFVFSRQVLAARILFPKEYIKDSTNMVKKLAYSSIVEEENKNIEHIKKDEVEKQAIRRKKKIIGKWFSLIAIGIFIVFYMKNNKDKYAYMDYLTDYMPKECSPAVLNKFIKCFFNDYFKFTTRNFAYYSYISFNC